MKEGLIVCSTDLQEVKIFNQAAKKLLNINDEYLYGGQAKDFKSAKSLK